MDPSIISILCMKKLRMYTIKATKPGRDWFEINLHLAIYTMKVGLKNTNISTILPSLKWLTILHK